MAEADPKLATATAELEAESPAPPKPQRKWGRLLLMLSLPLALLIGGVIYWRSLQGQVSTDNAYVHLDKVSVSAQVGGQITEVLVKENQHVKAGDLLFRIDPEPFQLQLSQADAAIASAQASQIAAANSSALSGADISAAEQNIAFARSTLARQEALWKKGFTTKADYEAAQHGVAVAEEQLKLARAKRDEAAAKLSSGRQLPGIYPQVAAATAQRRVAELSLRRTEVRAPVSGVISQANRLHPGQDIINGVPVLTLVADGSAYVEANFKETDLAEMRVGQEAKVRFDAYPGLVLKGHVASIGAGTGSEFSVLPAQNATGNWVKVTQRVPVRIVLDEASPRALISGLSTKVTVFIDGRKR
ncbi:MULTISPECIES: HlyD family secretion protein [unclassified Novosphingobium]|uniref:HlyD family secretion protein n=1 Tax=unclassified Novosphingobium TaxID=2644732 RepID=UPI0025D95134|nr:MULTISPECIES: HlyD family secretion protein [unclassified Novosphingobium]HQV04731.1 HlyD family secretion protein [Novosphingobium sp.]